MTRLQGLSRLVRPLTHARLVPVWVLAAACAAAVTLHAQNPITPAQAQAEFDRAARSFDDARFEAAFDSYTKAATARDPSLNVGARKGRIRSALRLALFRLAGREANVLMSERPDDVEAVTLQGDALWGEGLFDEAEGAYRLAATRFPSAPRARFGLARSLATRGQLEEALTEATAASASAPGDTEMLGFIAYLNERLYRYDAAIRVYESSLPLLPKRLRGDSELAGSKIKLLRGFAGRQPVTIDNEAVEPLHTVPFRLVDRKIVIDAKLNGRKLELVLDTGSERTSFSRDTARLARLTTLSETVVSGVGSPMWRRLWLARVDALEMGTLTIRNFPASIGDNIPGVPRWQNESFSPMSLGLSVSVDYQRQRVTLGRQLPKDAADFTLPLRVYRLPLVRGLLNTKHPASFVVDTGGELMSISSDMAGQIGPLPARRIGLLVFGINGPDREAFLLPGVDLGFQDLAYPGFSVAVLNLRAPSALLGFQLGGVLGYRFLSAYRVVMDVSRGELRLQKS